MTKKPIKLLILNTSTGWGGLEMNVVKLGHLLQKKGIEIHFICRKDSMFSQQIKHDFPHQFLLANCKKYFDFSNAKKIVEYAKTHDIRIVFTAYRPDLDVLLWAKKRLGSLRIIHQQQMQIGLPKRGVFQRMRMNAVDDWLTPLHWLKEELLEKTSIDAQKIHIVPLGVDTTKFHPSSYPTQPIAREFFGSFPNAPKDAFWIGVIGRIDEKKGQLFVVQMVKRLLDRGENIVLLIVGEATINDPNSVTYHQKIVDFIAENQLNDRIHIAPFTKNTHYFYAAIDLFVMSSQGETYGMVTIEAMLSEKPIIATNSGGTPELLQHGEYGVLYEVDSAESFETAYFEIRRRIDTHELNLPAIREKVAQIYSVEREIEGVYSAIDRNL